MDKPLIKKLELLNNLKIDSKPLWGKMTAQHMVEHLVGAFEMSFDKLKLNCFNPPEKLPVLKKFLMSNRPLPKDFINPVIGPDLQPLRFPNLQNAVWELTNCVNKYYEHFNDNPDALTTNPTFGELNKKEWDVFHEKHITHHFTQFGLEDK
ncbi:MAG: DUF1569 domain-containing protein [Bacteroidetes bacterium]|nr:DUF1569 domain-containing protein [Bacteroidota bacterium]